MPGTHPERGLNAPMRAVLGRLCERLGSIFLTQAVKLPYLVDVVAVRVLGRPIAGGTYQTWEHGVVAREVFRFLRYEADGDAVFRVEPHEYSESGKRVSLWGAAPEVEALTPDELAIIDFVAAELGGIAPEQLGFLTKRLNTEIPPGAWGTNAEAALNEEAFLRLGGDWQLLCDRIGEADLDDRSRWSEPINEDPKAAFLRILVTRDREEDVRLSPEELSELEAGLAEADRDETLSGEELFARLRRFEAGHRFS